MGRDGAAGTYREAATMDPLPCTRPDEGSTLPSHALAVLSLWAAPAAYWLAAAVGLVS